MNNLYLLQGVKTVLEVGTPILMSGTTNPFPDTEDCPCMKGIESVVVHVPQYGCAHDAALALLGSGEPALWCLSRDAVNTRPWAVKGQFKLPSPWSFLAIRARVHEVKERVIGNRTQITVTLSDLIGAPTTKGKQK